MTDIPTGQPFTTENGRAPDRRRLGDGARPAALDIQASEDGGVPLIRVAGEIDLSNSALLREAIETASESYPAQIVLDMSAVGFMDSTGLDVLLVASSRVNIVLRAPSRAVRRIGDVVGLLDIVSIEP